MGEITSSYQHRFTEYSPKSGSKGCFPSTSNLPQYWQLCYMTPRIYFPAEFRSDCCVEERQCSKGPQFLQLVFRIRIQVSIFFVLLILHQIQIWAHLKKLLIAFVCDPADKNFSMWGLQQLFPWNDSEVTFKLCSRGAWVFWEGYWVSSVKRSVMIESSEGQLTYHDSVTAEECWLCFMLDSLHAKVGVLTWCPWHLS